MERNVWIGIQFLLDLSLLFVILYLFYKSKKWGGPVIGGERQSAVGMNTEVNGLIEKLIIHIEEAKATSEKVTKEIDSKIREMKLLNEELEKPYNREAGEKRKDAGSQKYVEAIKLAKEGYEAEVICNRLGLLRGEVDLIIALNKV